MTAEAAIHQFFNSCGIAAYPDLDVPRDAALPYITYEQKTGCKGESAGLTVNVYYRDSSNTVINAKARELKAAILNGGMLECDDSGVWLKPGSPWCQAVKDESDPDIKRRYINVTAEFLTAE